MKILLHTNGPFVATGYGQQCAQIVPRLLAAGHEVAISAFYGVQGGVLNWNGVRVYPNGLQPYGQDVLIPHAKHFFGGEPGLILTLIDVWVLPPEQMKGNPVACWTPVDAYPPAPLITKVFKESGARPIAIAEHGVKALTEVGLDPLYAPHAIDTQLFSPGDREEAKRTLGWQDKFVVGMVAANKGNSPPRKGWSSALQAFARLAEKHDDAILMCHTDPFGVAGGVHLPSLAQACGISERVHFPDTYTYRNGYPPAYMPLLYNAFDVLLNPALGEGFGIPVLEAQACGTPVVVTDWSAMTELAGNGWLVDGDLVWNGQGSWWKQPSIDSIHQALEQAYEQAESKREGAREFALQYDADLIFETHWKPVLAELESQLPPRKLDPKDVIDTHDHEWAKTGLYNRDGSISAPCLDPECSAEQIDGNRIVEGGFSATINGIELDIEDDPNGAVAKIVCREIERGYDLDLDLKPGDTVIDVGAHVGIVSIYLAKKYPGIKVLALEPVPENYERLCRNIEANGVDDSVITIPYAITADGRPLELSGDLSTNSGGVSAFGSGANSYTADSTTLPKLLAEHGIDRVALLKIDCEGSEYEILTPDVLARVDRIRGEFHRIPDHVPEDLLEQVKGTVGDTIVTVCG